MSVLILSLWVHPNVRRRRRLQRPYVLFGLIQEGVSGACFEALQFRQLLSNLCSCGCLLLLFCASSRSGCNAPPRLHSCDPYLCSASPLCPAAAFLTGNDTLLFRTIPRSLPTWTDYCRRRSVSLISFLAPGGGSSTYAPPDRNGLLFK